MQLDARDLLSLAITGYRSQRAMASDMGVSHQKLGRWLNGISPVPADQFTQRGIETFFRQFSKRAKKWAELQGLPYIGPVMLDRRPLDKRIDGRRVLGDRVVIHNSQFIRRELRDVIIGAAHTTTRFMGVSVKSVVDLYAYFKRGDVPGAQRTDVQREYRRQLAGKFDSSDRLPIIGLSFTPTPRDAAADIRQPIYTKMTSMSRVRTSASVADELNAKIRHKHEPAAVKSGTVLASEILFQLYPAGYAPRKKKRRGPVPRSKPRAR